MKAFYKRGGPASKGFFGPNALTIGSPFPPPVTGGTTWTTLTTGFEGSTINYREIQFVNNTFVITGNDGAQTHHAVFTSTDAVTWTQHNVATTASPFRIESCAFGAGVYVVCLDVSAANPSVVYTSPDLVTWTQHSSSFAGNGTSLLGPVFNGTVFLLVKAGTSQYATSPDGVTWTQQNTYVPTSWDVTPIFDGIRFVALVNGVANTPKIAVSTDGVNWTESTVTLTTVANLAAITSNGSTQYIVGDFSDDNGVSVNNALTAQTTFSFNDGGNPTQALSFGGGTFTRCNSNNSALQSSSNGTVWAENTVPVAPRGFSGIAFGLGIFIAIGFTATANYTAKRSP